MGKGDTSASEAAAKSQANVAQQTLDFAKQVYGTYAPGAQYAQQTAMGVAKGGPDLARYVSPQVNQATQQFFTARQSAKNMPPGGARDAALRNLNLAEASTKTGIYSGGVQDALTRLYTGGLQGSGQAMTGYGQSANAFGGASQNYGNLANMQASMFAGGMSGLGSLAAMKK